MRGSSDFTSRPRTQSLAPNVSPVGLALAGNCLKLASDKGKGASNEMRDSRYEVAAILHRVLAQRRRETCFARLTAEG